MLAFLAGGANAVPASSLKKISAQLDKIDVILEKEGRKHEQGDAWKWFTNVNDLTDSKYSTEQLGMKCKSTNSVMKQKAGQKGKTTVNGCGADGGLQIVGLDDPFTPACMVHDVCYARCTDPTLWAKGLDDGWTTVSTKGLTKMDCDNIMYEMNMAICAGEAGGWFCEHYANAAWFVLQTHGDEAFTSAVDGVCECKEDESASDPSPSWYAAAENDFQTYRQHDGTDDARQLDAYTIIKPIAEKIFSDPRAFEMYAACSKKSANAGGHDDDFENRGKCHELVLGL